VSERGSEGVREGVRSVSMCGKTSMHASKWINVCVCVRVDAIICIVK
jgi:hypothetical protein